MRRLCCILSMLLLLSASATRAQDSRDAVEKAASDRDAALKRASDTERMIASERQALQAQIDSLEALKRSFESDIAVLDKKRAAAQTRRDDLADASAQHDLQSKKIANSLRIVAHHLDALMRNSPLAALDPERIKRIEPFLSPQRSPGLEDLPSFVNLFFDEIAFSQKIDRHRATYTDAAGADRFASILTIGKFMTAYQDSTAVGFLTYTPETQRFSVALAPPSAAMRARLLRYRAGKDESAPIDLSSGKVLRQAAQVGPLLAFLHAGGRIAPVVTALGAIILFLILYRALFSRRARGPVPKIRYDTREAARKDVGAEPEAAARRERAPAPVTQMIAGIVKGQVRPAAPRSSRKTALGLRHRKRVGVRIDMTPMVDVAFILLIFFMVTTLFRRPLAMEVNVPEPNAKVQVPASNVMTVYVEQNGEIMYDVGQLGLTAAAWGELRDLLALELEYNRDLIVLIKIDRNARFEKMVDILDAVDEAHIKRYSVVPMTDTDRTLIGGAQ